MSRAAPHPIVLALGAIADRMGRDMGDHSQSRQLLAEVNRLRGGADALDNVRASRSPLDTPAAHALKVGAMAKKFDREITAMLNRASQIMTAGAQDIQRRIDDKINLKPDAFAAEIRAAFRSLGSKAQGDLINKLIKEGRGPELAAIVRAPSVLTGISDEQRAAYEIAMVTTHAAQEYEEREKLEEVFDSAMAASRAAAGIAKSFTDPGELARIEREAAEANAAGEAFNNSLQSEA